VNYRLLVALVPTFALANAGCPASDITVGEASAAVEETSIASQASNLAEGSLELTTSFTLGQAVDKAAGEIAGFIKTELPCAQVTASGATLTIDYGANGDTCTWHGQNITGTHIVTVSKDDANDVLVHHEWDNMSNGRVEVSGTADVTWDLSAKTRHVVHTLNWTRLSDGRTGTGTGDRTQSPLDGDWAQGILIDGSRTWTGQAGKWDLQIDQVGWRWDDPVPESGEYALTTPANKELTLSFMRKDADTITVTVTGGKKSFHFDVSKIGDVGGGST
jgi:hypothetical protein